MSATQDGFDRRFYADGQIQSELQYQNGQLQGASRFWYSNGILAHEIPMVNDHIEGVASFWNDKGELLGTYEIRDGNGIQKIWAPNGVLIGETPLINNMVTGRQTSYWDDGSLASVVYYIRNTRVSKRKYFEACKVDASLPNYDFKDLVLPRKRYLSVVETMPRSEASVQDAFINRLLSGPRAKEARRWLLEGVATRTLGEMPSRGDSVQLVDEIYALGALNVVAVEIDKYPGGEENTGKVVIALPAPPAARSGAFQWYNRRLEERGIEPEADQGQDHLFLMLD